MTTIVSEYTKSGSRAAFNNDERIVDDEEEAERTGAWTGAIGRRGMLDGVETLADGKLS
jgi:hypothetical protein